MTTQASLLFACPFCEPGRGDLAIVPGKVARFALDNRQGLELILQDRPELDLVVYNPESDAQAPCPHLVSYSIRVRLVEIWRRRPENGGRAVSELAAPVVCR